MSLPRCVTNRSRSKHYLSVIGLFLATAWSFSNMLLVYAQSEDGSPGYPQSLQKDLETWIARERNDPANPDVLVHLAEIYLNAGDDLFVEHEKRVEAYEQGAAAAKRLWKQAPQRADAHFLYAANLGSLSQIKGLTYGALTLDEIRRHLEWTLLLDPRHAQALQFLGGLYAELPWMLGGDEGQAQEYLKRAIQIDENYTNARILLAKLLIKNDRIPEAKHHLSSVIHAKDPHYRYSWVKTFRPQAQKMLSDLERLDPR